MPTTLTSTGPVSLTSPANWSPSQTPAPGDDLIIAGHTLTADIDYTANTITFNNAASRLAISGTTRTLTATNGFFLTGNLGGNKLCLTDIIAGLTLSLFGKWTISAGASDLNVIANITGGTCNLSTVGEVQSNQLIEVTSAARFCCFSISSGTIHTTGLFNYVAANSAALLVNVNGGTWNHYSSGNNLFSNTSTLNALSIQGASNTTVNGNWIGSNTGRLALVSLTGTLTFNGNIICQSATQIFNMQSTVAIVVINGEIDNGSVNGTAVTNAGSGVIRWQNQTRTISAGKRLVFQVPVQLAGLVLDNFGKVLFSSGVVSDATTQIRMQSLASQLHSSDNNLDARVLPFQTSAPTLPAVQNVAAGTVYGYTGFTLTGTGLILDPAILASAIGTSSPTIAQSVWRRLRSADVGQAGAYGAVNEWAGAVDLQPVLNRLPDALENGRIKAVATLADDQAVNVTKVGGQAVSSPNDLKADVSGLASQTSVDSIANRLPTTLDNGRIRAKVEAESAGLAKETTVNAVGQAVVTVADGVTALLNRIPQDIFTGITRLARWLGILAGKSTDSGTLAEIQATTGGATFNNVSDSLEAIRDRGDVAWIGGAGNGEFQLTITVSDGTTGVANCRVSLVGTGLFAFTNTNGVATPFNVAGSATYTVRVTPPATFETPSDTSVVVAAQNVSQTIVVTAKPAVNPSAAPQCNVVLPVTDGAGSALTGAKVSIEFIRFESGATPSSVVIPPVPELTSASGVVTVPLLRLGRYRATYSYQNGVKDFEFIVPDSGSATIVEQV